MLRWPLTGQSQAGALRRHDRRRSARRRPGLRPQRLAMSSTSSSSAAAVTSAPAPGPWISNGCRW